MTEIQELIARFEHDVRFDAHGFVSKIDRSEATKALCKKALNAFPIVVDHLITMPEPVDDLDREVQAGLVCLLSLLGKELGLRVPRLLVFGKRSAWVEWAKKQTLPT